MKILVGNNKLRNPGGSETYTYTLVHELVKRGHDVVCVAAGADGITSDRIRRLGVPVIFKRVSGAYDLALLSHSTSIELVGNVHAFKVQTCHGIFHKLEQPIPGLDAYVAISQEVYSHLIEKGYNSTVIYNGVDCDRFSPSVRKISPALSSVLSLGHSDKANNMVREVCVRIGCKCIVRNKYNTPVWEMEHLISLADLVVGLGRGIYEAAACGRNAVIFDYRSYMGKSSIGDGFVTYNNFNQFLLNNCSGRYSNRVFKSDDLYDELLKYHPGMGDKLRLFALDYLNIEKQVDKYLALVR